MKSPAIRALLGLTLGLIVGAAIVWLDSAAGRAFASAVEPVGTIWVNALRMTVVPLVVSLLITTLASGSGVAMFGHLGRRAILIFLAMLVSIGIFGLFTAIPVYSLLHVDPVAAASLRATAAANMPANVTTPSFASWFTDLVPANIMNAASAGAMLPLIVFAVLFGLALGRIDAAHRAPLAGFFRAIAAAMLAIVQWVLLFAPIGAFALAVTVATHLGNQTAYVILFYILSHSGLLLVVLAL